MKKKQYSIHINAPVEKVFTVMLGLEDKSTYEAWTALLTLAQPLKVVGIREEKFILLEEMSMVTEEG